MTRTSMIDSGGGSHTQSQTQDKDNAGVLAPGIGKGSRSFSSILDIYQPTALVAQKIIQHYTLYQKPLLTPGEVLLLVESS